MAKRLNIKKKKQKDHAILKLDKMQHNCPKEISNDFSNQLMEKRLTARQTFNCINIVFFFLPNLFTTFSYLLMLWLFVKRFIFKSFCCTDETLTLEICILKWSKTRVVFQHLINY